MLAAATANSYIGKSSVWEKLLFAKQIQHGLHPCPHSPPPPCPPHLIPFNLPLGRFRHVPCLCFLLISHAGGGGWGLVRTCCIRQLHLFVSLRVLHASIGEPRCRIQLVSLHCDHLKHTSNPNVFFSAFHNTHNTVFDSTMCTSDICSQPLHSPKHSYLARGNIFPCACFDASVVGLRIWVSFYIISIIQPHPPQTICLFIRKQPGSYQSMGFSWHMYAGAVGWLFVCSTGVLIFQHLAAIAGDAKPLYRNSQVSPVVG